MIACKNILCNLECTRLLYSMAVHYQIHSRVKVIWHVNITQIASRRAIVDVTTQPLDSLSII